MVDIPSNQPPSAAEPPKEIGKKTEPIKAPHVPGSLKEALKSWREGAVPSDLTHTQIKIKSLISDPSLKALNGKQKVAVISSMLHDLDLDPEILSEYHELLTFHLLNADKELRS